MEDRYVEAIIDELERVGDLLQDLVKLQAARAAKEGITDLPRQVHRRADERRSAKVRSGPRREQP